MCSNIRIHFSIDRRTTMRRRNENKATPRFSRTFDLLLSQFPDAADLILTNSNVSVMSSKTTTTTTKSPWRSSVYAPKCVTCQKSVYPAEEVNAAGQKFHKICLKCSACQTILNPGNISEHDQKIYCGPCHRRQFGPRGLGRGLANCYSLGLETPPMSPAVNSRDESQDYPTVTSSLPIEPSPSLRMSNETSTTTTKSITNGTAFRMLSIGGNTCVRCSKPVYSAEEIKAIGKSFHRRCYNCAHCKGTISAGRYSEHRGEIYDNNCYRKLFAPKGVGFGMGAGTLSTEK